MSDILQLSKYNVHDTLIQLCNELPDNDVAIALSSGIDSISVLFALLECGKNVIAYSFTLDDRQSRDYLVAKDLSKKLDIPFNSVTLPTDINILKSDVNTMAKEYDCKKKTDFECFWPYMYLMRSVSESVLASGMAADGYFAISKTGSIHYKDDVQTFRQRYFSNDNKCQIKQRIKLARELNKRIFDPYLSKEMYDYLYQSTWEECNKPHQKMPIRVAFNYEQYIHIYQHTNFQLGDSGISEHFEQLLQTDLNTHNYKSVVGCYNEAVRRIEYDRKRTLF